MRQIPLGEGFGDATFGLVVMSAPGPGFAEGSKTHDAWFAIALDRAWYLRPVGPYLGSLAASMTDDDARERLFAHHMWEQRLAAARAEKPSS